MMCFPSIALNAFLPCPRKMTIAEKKKLGKAIAKLSPAHIDEVLEIIAQADPSFKAGGDTVEIDIDILVNNPPTLHFTYFLNTCTNSAFYTRTKGCCGC